MNNTSQNVSLLLCFADVITKTIRFSANDDKTTMMQKIRLEFGLATVEEYVFMRCLSNQHKELSGQLVELAHTYDTAIKIKRRINRGILFLKKVLYMYIADL